MAGTPRRRPVNPSIALAVFLLTALAIGLAAAFLSTPTSAPVGPGTTTFLGAPSALVVTIALLAVPVSITLTLIHGRIRGGSGGIPRRALSVFLVAFLIALVFLVVVHFASLGPLNSVNNTAVPPGGGPGSFGNGTGNLNNSTPRLGLPSVSQWGPYLGLGIALIVVLAILVPLLARDRGEEEGRTPPAKEPEVRQAFEQALTDLDHSKDQDPRHILIALYARLLKQLAPQVENLDAATPGEIERLCVARFHILPPTAHALRTLFEEARYSTHPLGERHVAEARAALTEALAQLGPEPLAP
ncbi:MAG: DUF4129 domain-containing protein [Thermoplasmata archaeon]|nr:DUF4129 domain-containing protein [Thermoplasmata archaeon]